MHIIYLPCIDVNMTHRFFQLSGAVATGGTASEDLEMIENADLGRDIVPVIISFHLFYILC